VIDDKLGPEGVALYRGIFDKNTHEQVKLFFSSLIIKLLWHGIVEFFSEEACLDAQSKDKEKAKGEGEGEEEALNGATALDFTETNCKITLHFRNLFNLDLPQWWSDKYPSGEITL